MILDKLICPKCNSLINHKEDLEIKRASSYEKCIRKCENCKIGFSNSRKKPTLIYKNFKDNLPEKLTQNIDFVLSNAVNERNRKNKISKFGFSTSEDALTWSFFNYFVINDELKKLCFLLDIDSVESSNIEIYFWGVDVNNGIKTKFYNQFIEVSDSFKEAKNSRTEPDVIIKVNDKLYFIEIKYMSSNDSNTNSNKFLKYLIQGLDIEKISKTSLYELYRNWVLALELSNGKDFELINLAPKKEFRGKNQKQIEEFKNLVTFKNGKFRCITWEEIYEKIKNDDYDLWFKEYLKLKFENI